MLLMKRTASLIVCGILLVAVTAYAKKKPEQYSEVSFVVVKDDGGQPVRNAAVVMHKVRKNGKQANAGSELKTDADGRSSYPGVPYGILRVQVIMPGFQTFGDDFTIDQPKQEITIRLKLPAKQYSIYEDHDKK
jgi:hypothetical protein